MLSDIILTALSDELAQVEQVEAACRPRCRALTAHWERAHDHLWVAQQEIANRYNERPEL